MFAPAALENPAISLLSMPPEVQTRIIEHTRDAMSGGHFDRDTLLAIQLTCRALQEVARPLLHRDHGFITAAAFNAYAERVGGDQGLASFLRYLFVRLDWRKDVTLLSSLKSILSACRGLQSLDISPPPASLLPLRDLVDLLPASCCQTLAVDQQDRLAESPTTQPPATLPSSKLTSLRRLKLSDVPLLPDERSEPQALEQLDLSQSDPSLVWYASHKDAKPMFAVKKLKIYFDFGYMEPSTNIVESLQSALNLSANTIRFLSLGENYEEAPVIGCSEMLGKTLGQLVQLEHFAVFHASVKGRFFDNLPTSLRSLELRPAFGDEAPLYRCLLACFRQNGLPALNRMFCRQFPTMENGMMPECGPMSAVLTEAEVDEYIGICDERDIEMTFKCEREDDWSGGEYDSDDD